MILEYGAHESSPRVLAMDAGEGNPLRKSLSGYRQDNACS